MSKTNYQQFYLKWLNRKRNIFCRKCKMVKALSIFETFKDCCQSKFQCEYRLANYFQFFDQLVCVGCLLAKTSIFPLENTGNETVKHCKKWGYGCHVPIPNVCIQFDSIYHDSNRDKSTYGNKHKIDKLLYLF